MDGATPELTPKQAVVDTILLCVTLFASSLFFDSLPLKIILGFGLLMSSLETLLLVLSSYGATDADGDCGPLFLLFAMLAFGILFLIPLQWKEYMLCLGLTIVCDASGLLFGRAFGKRHPFFSRRVSPNKTYAGYFAQMVCSILFGLIAIYLMDMQFSAANIAFVCSGFIACSIGDLMGSDIKRAAYVQHSCEALSNYPKLRKLEVLVRSRHGYLDCFDSITISFLLYVTLIKCLG